LAAAVFLGGQSRLKAGCGQNCPPYKLLGRLFAAIQFLEDPASGGAA